MLAFVSRDAAGVTGDVRASCDCIYQMGGASVTSPARFKALFVAILASFNFKYREKGGDLGLGLALLPPV